MSIHHKQQDGFTIVELMIATVVLSVILLLTTVMITSIGNIYYKGINQSRLQDDARNITNEIAEHLQINNVPVSSGTEAFNTGLGRITLSAYCINNTRYSYYLNTQIGTQAHQLEHILWRDTYSGNCLPVNLSEANPEQGLPAAQQGTSGVELIAPDSLLTAFSISAASPYTVTIGLAFASYSPSGLNTVLNYTGAHAGVNASCVGGKGDDFCATASLSTTVVQRIT